MDYDDGDFFDGTFLSDCVDIDEGKTHDPQIQQLNYYNSEAGTNTRIDTGNGHLSTLKRLPGDYTGKY